MNIIYYILAVLCGIGQTTQSGVNSELRKSINNPLFAAIISFIVGLLSLLIIYPFFNRSALPSIATIKSLEWWKFTGGLFGAFFVTSVIFSIQKIGSANMTVLIIAGQLFMTILLDHYGWLGFNIHQVNIYRILGGILIIGGAYLILRN
jgi:bacterial/archaeal transporter family-2 protein